MGMGGGCNESESKSGNVRESIGVDDGVRSNGSPDWVGGTTFALGLACLPLAREKVENHEAGRGGGVDVELERGEDVTGGGGGVGDSETNAEASAASEGGVAGGVRELSWLMGGNAGKGRTSDASSATALDNGVLVAVEGVASVEISFSCEKEYPSTHTYVSPKTLDHQKDNVPPSTSASTSKSTSFPSISAIVIPCTISISAALAVGSFVNALANGLPCSGSANTMDTLVVVGAVCLRSVDGSRCVVEVVRDEERRVWLRLLMAEQMTREAELAPTSPKFPIWKATSCTCHDSTPPSFKLQAFKRSGFTCSSPFKPSNLQDWTGS